jgi:small-conductance mechanosensitive channel
MADTLQHVGEWFESGAWLPHAVNALAAAVILFLGVTAARLLSSSLQRLRATAKDKSEYVYIVEKLGAYGLVVAAGLVAVSTLGIDLSSLTLLGGAVGVGAGLGLQGVVRQFVSGMVVIFDPQLNVGDFVELEDGLRGEILEVGPRATRIRTNDGASAIIPNSQLIENRVVNWTLGGTRRIHVPFMVDHGVDKARVRDAVLKAAHEVPFTLPDSEGRKTQVWLTGFSDSGLTFELVVWPTNDAVRRPSSMRAAYSWAIESALREAGVGVPSQQLDVRLLNMVAGGADAEPVAGKRRAPPSARPPNDAAENLVADAEREAREKAAEEAARAVAAAARGR